MIPKEQIHILRHAIGISSTSNGGHRNYFMASDGGPDLACCLDLVNQGLMVERIASEENRKVFPDRCFHCTDAGIKAAREGGAS